VPDHQLEDPSSLLGRQSPTQGTPPPASPQGLAPTRSPLGNPLVYGLPDNPEQTSRFNMLHPIPNGIDCLPPQILLSRRRQ
jgi:hypothetical protein